MVGVVVLRLHLSASSADRTNLLSAAVGTGREGTASWPSALAAPSCTIATRTP